MYRLLSVWVLFSALHTSSQLEIKSFLTVYKEGRTDIPVLVTVNYDEETISAKPVPAPHNDEETYSDYKKKFILRRFQLDGSPACFLEHVEDMSFHADLDLLRKVKRSLKRNPTETLIISNASISNDDLKSLDSAALNDLCRDLQVYLLAPSTIKIKHATRSKRAAHGRGRQPIKQRFHGQVEAQVSPANDGSPGPEAFAIASPNAAVTKVGGTSGYAHAKSQVTVESDYGHGKSIRTMSSTSTFSSSRGSGGGGATQHQGGYGAAPQRGTYPGVGQYPIKGQTKPVSQNGYHRGAQAAFSTSGSVHSGGAASGTVHGQGESSQYPASYEGRVPSGHSAQDSPTAESSGGSYRTYQWTVKHPNGYNAAHWYTGPLGSDGKPAIVEGPVESAPLQVNIPGGSGGRTVISTSASGGGDLHAIGVGISQSASIAERAHVEAQSILSATETQHSQGHHAASVHYPARQPSQQQQVHPVQQTLHAPSHPQQQHSQHTAFAGTHAQEARLPTDQATQAVYQQHYPSPHPQEPISQPVGSLPYGSVSPVSTAQQEVRPSHRPSYHIPSQPQQAHTHHATSASSYTREAHGVPSGQSVPQEQLYQQQPVRQPHVSYPVSQQVHGSPAYPQQVIPAQPQPDYVRQTVQQPVPHGGHHTQQQTFSQDVSQTSAMEAMAQHVHTQTERIPVQQPAYPVHIPQPQPSLQQEETHQPRYHGGIAQQGGVLVQSASSATHVGQVHHAHQVQPSHPQVQPSHHQVQPSYHQVQPSHQQVQPSHQQVQPSHRQVQPNHPQVQPSHPQVQPSHHQVQQSYHQVQQSYHQVQPNHHQVLPSRPDHGYPAQATVVQQPVAVGAVAKPLPVPQPGQIVQDVRGQQVFQVVSGRIETVEDGARVLQPGQTIPELPGSSVPQGFRGRVVQAGADVGHGSYRQPSSTTQHFAEGHTNIHQQQIQQAHPQQQGYAPQQHGYLPQQPLQQQPSEGQSGPHQVHPQYVQQRPHAQQEQPVAGQIVLPQQHYPQGPVIQQQGHSEHQVYQQQSQQHVRESQSASQPIQPQQHVQQHPQPYPHQLHPQRQQPLGMQTGSQQPYPTQQVQTQRQIPAQHQTVQQQQVHSQQTYTQQQVYPQQVAQPQFTGHSEAASQNEYVPTPQEIMDSMPSAQGGVTGGRLPQEQPRPQQTQRPTGAAVRPNGNGRTPTRPAAPQTSTDTQDCTPAYYTCKIVYGPVKSDQVCLPPPPCCVPC